MAASKKIIDLRNVLAERFPHSHFTASGNLITGIAELDRARGGLAKGEITELISPQPSAGIALLIQTLLRAAHQDRYFVALIDGRDSFDPEPLGNERLRNLLWVRCEKAVEAVKAADLLLRDGNFPLVILDLVLNPAEELRKIPQTHWYRLQRLVEPAPTAFLILTRRSMVSSAHCKLVCENSWTLPDLERENTISQLEIRVQRLHNGRQIAGAN